MTPAPAQPGLRRCAAPAAVLGLALAAVAAVSAWNPNQSGHYPSCPFLLITGLYCPGCGSLRATYALGHGQLDIMFARNPLYPLGLVMLAFIWGAWLRRRFTGRPRQWAAPAWSLWLFLGLVLLFWFFRNLPGWEWLAP